MKIRRSPVVFHNVLKMTDCCNEGSWDAMALVLRNLVIMNGLYTNAPAFYQVSDIAGEPGRKEYSVYISVSSKVEPSDELPVEFMDELAFDDALTFRVADSDTPLEEAYFLLDACAAEQGMSLVRPFYHVCFDVFGETMVDVIAPVALATAAEEVGNVQP